MKLVGIKIANLKLTKSGKLENPPRYRNVSQRIAAKKSTKVKVVKGKRP